MSHGVTSISSARILRRAINISGNDTILIIVIVLGALISLAAILWVYSTYKYRQQRRAQPKQGSSPTSKTAYRKLQKKRISKESVHSSTDDSITSEKASDPNSHYVHQRYTDVESQLHNIDADSIYEDQPEQSFSPSQLIPRSSIRRPQPATPNPISLCRNASITSHYSYERHVNEYAALVTPELQKLLNEQHHPSSAPPHPDPYALNHYTREELMDILAQDRQLEMTRNNLTASLEHCYRRQKSRPTIENTSQPLSDSTNQNYRDDSSPPLPRKSSRRTAVPTSIDQRISAPAVVLTCPSTSTLNLTNTHKVSDGTRKWKIGGSGDPIRNTLLVPQRLSKIAVR